MVGGRGCWLKPWNLEYQDNPSIRVLTRGGWRLEAASGKEIEVLRPGFVSKVDVIKMERRECLIEPMMKGGKQDQESGESKRRVQIMGRR